MAPARRIPVPALSPAKSDTNWSLYVALAATVLFLASLPAPCFRMRPSLGSSTLQTVVEFTTGESFAPKTYSLVGSVRHLLEDGQLFLGTILLLFSIVFPVTKLTVLLLETSGAAHLPSPYSEWLKELGKWSMLDVLVLAILVVAFKAFPGGTRIDLCWGAALFGLSVLFTMLASRLVAIK